MSTSTASTRRPAWRQFLHDHWKRYALALGLVGLSVLARYVFDGDVLDRTPFSVFFPAMIFAAWYGGLGPGLFVTVLGGFAGQHLWADPTASTVDPEAVARLGTFVSVGVITSLLCEAVHRAHGRIQNRERNLRQLTDSLPVLIAHIDEDQRYRFCNRAYSEWFGVVAENAVGKHVWEVLGNEGYRAIRKPLEKSLQGESMQYETELPIHGESRHVSVTYVPARDDEGRVRGVFALAYDISDRIRVEQTRREADRKVKNILESVSDAFYALDTQWRFVYLNTQAERYFGEPSEKLLGENIWDEIPEKRGSVYEEQYRLAMATGQAVSFETCSPFGDKWVEVHAYPSAEGLSVYFSDISRRKQVEQALRESKEQLHLALEAAHMGTWEWDITSGAVTWSEQLEALHGLPTGQFDGKFETFLELLHPDDVMQLQADLAQTLDRDVPFNTEFRIVWPDGSIHWLAGLGRVFRDSDGKATKMIGMGLDVTDRKQAELGLQQSEQRFRLAAETASDLIYEWDIATDRVEWFGNVDAALGHSHGAFPRRLHEWHERLPADDRDRVMAARRQHLKSGGAFAQEYRVLRADGEHCIWTDRGSAIRDSLGRPTKWIGVTTDVTQQRQNEVQRAELLERERMARSAAETAQAKMLEEDRRKNEFLAMLGHELRNPLGAITNAVQLFKLVEPHSEAFDQASHVLERQSDHMARLVDDLLDVSRITRGKIELRKEVVELRAIVERAVDVGQALVTRKKHQLTVTLPDEPVFLEVDPARAEQILSNLLINAAKYTDPNGKISLVAAAHAGNVVVTITDNGIGIAPETLPRIFDLFTQADHSLDRSQGGLGIGLTLVRSLVELHGGRVEARSAGAGRGSQFEVVLPRYLHDTTIPTPQPPSEAEATAARRILVVDDNADIARLLSVLLTNSGHHVQVAHDGIQALARVDEFKPQAVLLDIGLPGMNGYEVARQLRALPAYRETLLIAMTGYGQASDRQKAFDAGFDHHLVKPVRVQSLLELLVTPRGAGQTLDVPS